MFVIYPSRHRDTWSLLSGFRRQTELDLLGSWMGDSYEYQAYKLTRAIKKYPGRQQWEITTVSRCSQEIYTVLLIHAKVKGIFTIQVGSPSCMVHTPTLDNQRFQHICKYFHWVTKFQIAFVWQLSPQKYLACLIMELLAISHHMAHAGLCSSVTISIHCWKLALQFPQDDRGQHQSPTVLTQPSTNGTSIQWSLDCANGCNCCLQADGTKFSIATVEGCSQTSQACSDC